MNFIHNGLSRLLAQVDHSNFAALTRKAQRHLSADTGSPPVTKAAF
ncbi:hypothetical protein [Leucobacter insecticola]|nr:hypothetical protein [Leucobacter insecticola]